MDDKRLEAKKTNKMVLKKRWNGLKKKRKKKKAASAASGSSEDKDICRSDGRDIVAALSHLQHPLKTSY